MGHLIDAIGTPPSIAIADTVRSLEASGIFVAKLQTGEPSFATPTYIVEAACQALHRGETHYSNSQGIPELRQAIADWYYEDYGVEISHENILIGNGAIHVIYCLIGALVREHDEVIIPEPYWPQYKNVTSLAGGTSCIVNTLSTGGKLTVESFEENITPRTKLLILNNPCNPTGIVYSSEEIDALLRVADQNKIWVLFDEVYSRILYSDRFCSVLQSSLFQKLKSRIFYINSFSKTFSMTGWRIGYAFLPESFLPSALKISQNTVTNTNTFSQFGAIKAVQGRVRWQEEYTHIQALYNARKAELERILSDKGHLYFQPEGAFYFFIQCALPSQQFAIELLNQKRIAVVPGVAYGENCDNYYRISFAVDETSYRKFIEFIENSN
jgi:aspartate aminotransferase